MFISTKGRYALRTLIDMAEHQSDGYLPLKDIAVRQEISEKYLESIVKILVAGGLVTGVRGKGGGYRLSKAPEQILVGDVLRLSEGSLVPVTCLEETSTPCPRMVQCRTLPFWTGLQKVIDDYIDSYTVSDLIRPFEAGNDYVI